MGETGNFGSWKEKKRAELVSSRFNDVRHLKSPLEMNEDLLVDAESAMSIKSQIGKKEITWNVDYYGVVRPEDVSLDNDRQYATANCIDPNYINLFVFQTSNKVNWFILSPNYNYK